MWSGFVNMLKTAMSGGSFKAWVGSIVAAGASYWNQTIGAAGGPEMGDPQIVWWTLVVSWAAGWLVTYWFPNMGQKRPQ